MFLLLFQAMLNQSEGIKKPKKQYNSSGPLMIFNSGIRRGLTQRQPGDKKGGSGIDMEFCI